MSEIIPHDQFGPVMIGDRMTTWDGDTVGVVIVGAKSADDLSFNTASWPPEVTILRVDGNVREAAARMGGIPARGFVRR
jgi:hypothetical protein